MKLIRKHWTAIALMAAGALMWQSASSLPIPTVKKPIDPIAIDSGLVAGKVLDTGVRAWFGVPFAASPVRELRWQPPQSISWEGIYNADRFQPACIQSLRGSNINHYFGNEATSEDCLYLNIWAPPESDADSRGPVIVWIYGGGFGVGSAAMRNYAGEGLAQKGAVYVSISYRVGALGFLAHPELSAESPHRSSGNYGLLDQVSALEWVQRNIDKFGGDPDNVTIMGQSAGSMSASSLQVSPLTKNLFHKIVGMSGSFFDRYQATLDQAEKDGLQFQEALGAESLQELRYLAADRIHAYSQNCRPDCVRVSPIVDGYFMPDQPSEIFARGEQRDVPVMIGYTRDEGFSAIGFAKTLDDYRNVLHQAYGDAADELMNRYPASDDVAAWRAARDVARDSTLGLSMRAWADLQYKHGQQPAYAYMFARVQPYAEGITFADHDPATVGSYHTADVPYWLQTLDSLNLFRETRIYTPYDRQLADLMSNTIIAFAETGNPTTEIVDWPAYSPEDNQLVEFGLTIERPVKTILWPNSDSLEFFSKNQAKPVDLALLPGRRARD